MLLLGIGGSRQTFVGIGLNIKLWPVLIDISGPLSRYSASIVLNEQTLEQKVK